MKYRITIEQIIYDPNEQREYDREKKEELYQQTLEKENFDLKKVIDAFNE